jgi:hypothetical protein
MDGLEVKTMLNFKKLKLIFKKYLSNPSTLFGTYFHGILVSLLATLIISIIFTRNPTPPPPQNMQPNTNETVETIKDQNSNSQVNIASSQKVPNVNQTESLHNMKYYPLEINNYWIYEYFSKTSNDGININVVNKEIKVEVTNIYRNDTFIIVELSADPLNGDSEPCGLLLFNKKIFIVYDVQKFLKMPKDEIYTYIQNHNPEFELPLFDGQTYSYDTDGFRGDTGYMYKVTELDDSFKLKDADKKITKYQIRYRTLSDCTIIIFVPNVGIESVKYTHFGTLMS